MGKRLYKLISPMAPLAICLLLCSNCGFYSFTGVTLDPNIQDISIQNFFNDTGNGPANLGQNFTETLRDYYQQNTSLALVNFDGDLQLEGSISNYRVQPVAAAASPDPNLVDAAGLQRLNITVRVNFVNTVKEEESFKRNFSFYADYDPESETLTAAETRLVDEIIEQLVFDIFNATVANW